MMSHMHLLLFFFRRDTKTTVKRKNRIPTINPTYSSFNHVSTPNQEKGYYQKHGLVFLSDQYSVWLGHSKSHDPAKGECHI